MALNDIKLKSIPYATGNQYVVWDFPSFGVRVGKRTKTFVLKIGNDYHVIGRYPIISLKEAREEAKRRLALKRFLIQ